MSSVPLDGHTWLVIELSHGGMGSPFDGCCRRCTMDCDSVVVCAARWSHMACGDSMVYASGLYLGGLPVMVGWEASLVVIADSTTTTKHPHQSFHARLFCTMCV